MKDGVRLGNGYSGIGGGSTLKRKYELREHSRAIAVGTVPVNDFILVRQGRDTRVGTINRNRQGYIGLVSLK